MLNSVARAGRNSHCAIDLRMKSARVGLTGSSEVLPSGTSSTEPSSRTAAASAGPGQVPIPGDRTSGPLAQLPVPTVASTAGTTSSTSSTTDAIGVASESVTPPSVVDGLAPLSHGDCDLAGGESSESDCDTPRRMTSVTRLEQYLKRCGLSTAVVARPEGKSTASRSASTITPLLVRLTGSAFYIEPVQPELETRTRNLRHHGALAAPDSELESDSESERRIQLSEFPAVNARVYLEHNAANKFDRNAIQVMTAPSEAGGKMIGHVEKGACESLLPFLRVHHGVTPSPAIGIRDCDFFEIQVTVAQVERIPEPVDRTGKPIPRNPIISPDGTSRRPGPRLNVLLRVVVLKRQPTAPELVIDVNTPDIVPVGVLPVVVTRASESAGAFGLGASSSSESVLPPPRTGTVTAPQVEGFKFAVSARSVAAQAVQAKRTAAKLAAQQFNLPPRLGVGPSPVAVPVPQAPSLAAVHPGGPSSPASVPVAVPLAVPPVPMPVSVRFTATLKRLIDSVTGLRTFESFIACNVGDLEKDGVIGFSFVGLGFSRHMNFGAEFAVNSNYDSCHAQQFDELMWEGDSEKMAELKAKYFEVAALGRRIEGVERLLARKRLRVTELLTRRDECDDVTLIMEHTVGVHLGIPVDEVSRAIVKDGPGSLKMSNRAVSAALKTSFGHLFHTALRRVVSGSKPDRYSDRLIAMCTMISSKSPAGYRMLHEFFRHLPSQSTLQRREDRGSAEGRWDSRSILLMKAAADRRGLSRADRIGYLCTDDVSLEKSLNFSHKGGGVKIQGFADGFVCPSSTVRPKVSVPGVTAAAASGSSGGNGPEDTAKSQAHDNLMGSVGTHEGVCLFTSFSEEFRFVIGAICVASEDTLRTLKQVMFLIDGIAMLHAAGFEVYAIVNDNGSINTATRRTFTACESFTSSVKTTEVTFTETADFSVKHPILSGRRLFFLPDQEHLYKTIRNCMRSSRHRNDDERTRRIVAELFERSAEGVRAPRFMPMHWGDYETTYHFQQRHQVYSIMPKFSKEMVMLDDWSVMRVSLAKQALSVRAAQTIAICYQDSCRMAAANLAAGYSDSSDQSLMLSNPAGTCEFIEAMAYIVTSLDPDCSRRRYGMNDSEDGRIANCLRFIAHTKDVHERYAKKEVASRGLVGGDATAFTNSCGLSRETLNALDCMFNGMKALLKQYKEHFPRENMAELPPKMRVPTQQCLEGVFGILRYSGKADNNLTAGVVLSGIRRLQNDSVNYAATLGLRALREGKVSAHCKDDAPVIQVRDGVCPAEDPVLKRLWQLGLFADEVVDLDPIVKRYRIAQREYATQLYSERLHPDTGKRTVTWGGAAWSQRRKVCMVAIMKKYFLPDSYLAQWAASVGTKPVPILSTISNSTLAILLTLLSSDGALAALHDCFEAEFRRIREAGGKVKVVSAEEAEAGVVGEEDDDDDSSDDDSGGAPAASGAAGAGVPSVARVVTKPALIGDQLAFQYVIGWVLKSATKRCAKSNLADACFVLDHFNSSFGAVMTATAAPGERLYRATDGFAVFMAVVEKCAVANLGIEQLERRKGEYYNDFIKAVLTNGDIDSAWDTLLLTLGSPLTKRAFVGQSGAKAAVLRKFLNMRVGADSVKLGVSSTTRAGAVAFRTALKVKVAKPMDPQRRAMLTAVSVPGEYHATFTKRTPRMGLDFAVEPSAVAGHSGRLALLQVDWKLVTGTCAYFEGPKPLTPGDVLLAINGQAVTCDDDDCVKLLLETGDHFPVTMKFGRPPRDKGIRSLGLTALNAPPWTIKLKSTPGGAKGAAGPDDMHGRRSKRPKVAVPPPVTEEGV